MTEIINGNEVGSRIKNELSKTVTTLADSGVTPGLATVLMSDDGASEAYVSMKQQACKEIGVEGYHREIDPNEPASTFWPKSTN